MALSRDLTDNEFGAEHQNAQDAHKTLASEGVWRAVEDQEPCEQRADARKRLAPA